jgi:demethylmenaquinone methyltransferase/2-methoxy-6-polyprenyl-1,4-benzoquinol methylase
MAAWAPRFARRPEQAPAPATTSELPTEHRSPPGTDGDLGLPTGPAKVAMVKAMFDTIAPRYDLVNRLMTFGLDTSWRHRAVSGLALTSGSVVLDLACGTGDLGRMLARRGIRAVGLDLSAGMLAAGQAAGPLIQGDAAALPLAEASVDGVVCGFALRNVDDLAAVLREVARVVRPGGRMALLEVDEPSGPLVRLGHRLWFEHGVPILGGLLSNADAYRYLPRSVAYLPPRPVLRHLIVGSGFSGVNRRPLSGGVAQLITATRTGLVPYQEPRRAAGQVVPQQ